MSDPCDDQILPGDAVVKQDSSRVLPKSYRKYEDLIQPLPCLGGEIEDYEVACQVTREAQARYMGNFTALPNVFAGN